MIRIAFIGPKGSGKSLLAYTFSAYLKHRQVPVAAVNLDSSAHKLSYVPDLDVRHFVRDAEPSALYLVLFKDDVYLDAMGALSGSAALLDLASGLDWLWFSELPDFCDAAWLLTPELASSTLMAAISEKLDVPVLNVVNQRRFLATDQKTLSSFSLAARARKDTVFINAWERDGFDALSKHLGALAQTA